jgi:hypothetical protein
VDIRVGVLRRVEVDDAVNSIHVNATRGDVCSDEDARTSRPELLESAVALGLGAVTVDCNSGETCLVELFRKTIRTVLGTAEDDRGAVTVDKARGKARALVTRSAPELMAAGSGVVVRLPKGVLGGLVLEVTDETLHVLIERRREKHRLVGGTDLTEKLPNCGQESHVGHAVSLVDDYDFDCREIKVSALEKIDESPRATDDNVDAAA